MQRFLLPPDETKNIKTHTVSYSSYSFIQTDMKKTKKQVKGGYTLPMSSFPGISEEESDAGFENLKMSNSKSVL